MKSRHLVFNQFGNPSFVLNLEELTLPPLRGGEVMLEILASPINPADLNLMEGTYGVKPELPATAGLECVARVVESKSKLFSPGDIVMPLSRIGGWADHAITHEQNLIQLPSGIDPLQAAMLKVNPATAFLLLTHFEKLQTGDWVALNAANSGVGQCTIQLAKHLGFRTLCFLRNISLIPELKKLGATEVFEDSPAGYASALEALGQDKAKLAFNAVGGESALRIMKLLGPSGTHITYGAMAKKPLTVPNGPLIFNDIRLRGLWVTQWIRESDSQTLNQTYTNLAELILDGKLTQAIDNTYDLADFSKALARLNQPMRSGKIIFHKKIDQYLQRKFQISRFPLRSFRDKLTIMNGNPKSGFTLLEMTVVILVLLSLMGTGLFVSSKYSDWSEGRAASEELRKVYSAQRLYLADNPTTLVSAITSANLVPYLANGATALPTVESLEGTTLTIKVDVTPPVFLKGSVIYDPSGSTLDSLWDVGQ